MAEPLKNYFDERVPQTIAAQISAVWPEFASEAFMRDSLSDYEALGLMDRGRQIARSLRTHLPTAYREALTILLRSVGGRPQRTDGDGGMASFLYLPHLQFVELHGIDDFEASMQALHFLTQRFTGEYALRPFLDRYEQEALAVLREWAHDPDPHVRRLVSEGTRPRLPWAGRLRRFQEDPTPVLELLELLRDDPDSTVRRSVANNLNDIGKDHPERLLVVARKWVDGAGEERLALLRHALRTLVKAGNSEALKILGFTRAKGVELVDRRLEPAAVRRGEAVEIAFDLRNAAPTAQHLLVDLRVHYRKANGSTSPKVFKLRSVELPSGEVVSFRKRLSLADLTTRRHHAGVHRVEALINGIPEVVGEFHLADA